MVGLAGRKRNREHRAEREPKESHQNAAIIHNVVSCTSSGKRACYVASERNVLRAFASR